MNASSTERNPIRKAAVYQQGTLAGFLEEQKGGGWSFTYTDGYFGEPVSLTMPISQKRYDFEKFPPPFEGLLPEGILLEAFLRRYKLDADDFFGQLSIVGQNVVGSLSIKEVA